jgi:hypothetical protein
MTSRGRRRKQPRVPPTLSKLVSVAREHMEPAGVYIARVGHDEWCPTLRSQRILDCRCDAVVNPPERIDR